MNASEPNCKPIAAIGDRVQTYDGPGVVVDVYPDAFYGGMAYVIETAKGRTTFDCSRIRKVS